jgi:hypothetical protein
VLHEQYKIVAIATRLRNIVSIQTQPVDTYTVPRLSLVALHREEKKNDFDANTIRIECQSLVKCDLMHSEGTAFLAPSLVDRDLIFASME